MSGTTINSQTQRIVVNAASKSISIINAGPQGPAGVPGPSEASLVLDTDGQLLTRVSGELAPITRVNLAADSSFRTTINHGSTSGTARTGSHPIKWIGSVDPTNAANDDEWFNASNARQYIRIASAWVNLMSVPVGVVLDYSGSTPPSNFLAIDGSTIVGGQTLYPDLWTVIPASWKSGANIVLPDGRGRTSIGSGTGVGLTARTLGSTGGSETHTLSAAESGVPAHSHTLGSHTHGMQSHTHSGTTGGINANHTHGFSGTTSGQSADHYHAGWGGGNIVGTSGTVSAGITVTGTGYAYAPNTNGASNDHSHTYSGNTGTVSSDHGHPFTTGGPSNNTTTGPTGGSDNNSASAASSAHNNMQPWLALNKIICCK